MSVEMIPPDEEWCRWQDADNHIAGLLTRLNRRIGWGLIPYRDFSEKFEPQPMPFVGTVDDLAKEYFPGRPYSELTMHLFAYELLRQEIARMERLTTQ
jgi:hypothetical protein